jgi:hypothetical protein
MSTRDELHRLIDRLSEEVFPDAARQLTEPHQRNRADATEAEPTPPKPRLDRYPTMTCSPPLSREATPSPPSPTRRESIRDGPSRLLTGTAISAFVALRGHTDPDLVRIGVQAPHQQVLPNLRSRSKRQPAAAAPTQILPSRACIGACSAPFLPRGSVRLL